MPKYKEYIRYNGKIYGVDRYGVTHAVNGMPKSMSKSSAGSKRSYTVGAGHSGVIKLSDKYKYSFPKDMYQSMSKNRGVRVSDGYIKPYKGRGFGKSNPFSPLNIRINGAKKNFTGAGGLNFAWLRNHLARIGEKIALNAMNYTVILSIRAQKIFQDSFKYKRFYTAGGGKWQKLSDKTIKKRMRKGTWPGAGGPLREYGDMYKSIKVRRGTNDKFMGGVYTDPNEYVQHEYTSRKGGKMKDRRGVFCYAGLHNDGGKIRHGVHLPQRQFMGHSTYLFEFALQQADRYLFFNVFD